jgi:hypothetical protein
MEIVLSSVMFLTVVFADLEDDGSFNYLLERRNGGTERQYSIAHSYPADMGLKTGDGFYARVEAKCSPVWALDKVSSAMEEVLPYGASRQSYICNADSISINGKKYKSLVREDQK